MTATNKPKDAKVREWWLSSIVNSSYPDESKWIVGNQSENIDFSQGAEDVRVVEMSALLRTQEKLASLEKMIAVSEKALEAVEKCWFDRNKEQLACSLCDCGEAGEKVNDDGHDYYCAISIAHAALEQIKQMKAVV